MRLPDLCSVGPFLVTGLLLGAACLSRPSPGSSRSVAPTIATSHSGGDDAVLVVATVGGVPIRAGQVANEMRQFHVEAKRALDSLVTFEVLAKAAKEARTAPPLPDTEASKAIRVQRLIEREIEGQLAPTAIPEADVRALYERYKKRFVHGRLVEIAVLSVFTGARMKSQPRALVEENARLLKSFVDGRAAKTAEFEAIAKSPTWSDRKVNFSTVWQSADEPFPPVVGRAVQGLFKPGDTTDLVGDETGYYLARYLSEKAPENVTFSAAAIRIREEMYEPWRRREFLRLSLALGLNHEIQLFPENFPKLVADTIVP